MAEAIRPGGTVVLNADDPRTAALAGRPAVRSRQPVNGEPDGLARLRLAQRTMIVNARTHSDPERAGAWPARAPGVSRLAGWWGWRWRKRWGWETGLGWGWGCRLGTGRRMGWAGWTGRRG